MKKPVVPGFGRKSKKPNTFLYKKRKELPPDDAQQKQQKRQKEFETTFRALLSEFSRVELEHSGNPPIDHQTGVFRWPSCWVDTMKNQEWADKIGVIPPERSTMEACTRLNESELSPMSEELRRLAKALHLPLYKGTAPPGKTRTKPMNSVEKKTIMRRQRCPKCGSWLIPIEIAKFRRRGPAHPLDFGPKKLSGRLVCGSCHYDG